MLSYLTLISNFPDHVFPISSLCNINKNNAVISLVAYGTRDCWSRLVILFFMQLPYCFTLHKL
jgi:hypothetical protein